MTEGVASYRCGLVTNIRCALMIVVKMRVGRTARRVRELVATAAELP
jgi:hypothetical protein